MAKKVRTPEEQLRKVCNDNIGIGILYLVLSGIVNVLTLGIAALVNPFYIAYVAGLILMVVGCIQRKKLGVIGGWIFEAILVFSAIIGILTQTSSIDIVDLIVIIGLPFNLVKTNKLLNTVGDVNKVTFADSPVGNDGFTNNSNNGNLQ